MLTDSDTGGPRTDLQRFYSGYLLVGKLSEETARHVADLAGECGMLDVSPTAIELEYKGRDSSHVVVGILVRLARLIGNAEGEIQCQVTGDTDQLWFEFYRIRDGRLFRQRAEVVRQPEEEITEGDL